MQNEAQEKPTSEDLPCGGRRQFLASLLGVSAAAAAAIPLINVLICPPPDKIAEGLNDWQTILKPAQLTSDSLAEIDKPTRVIINIQNADRWHLSQTEVTLYVTRKDKSENGFQVFSGICPHAGCAVDYQKKENRFFCPCHDGVFDLEGKVLDGPPPRGLDPIEFRVTDKGLEVKFTRYRLNTSERQKV